MSITNTSPAASNQGQTVPLDLGRCALGAGEGSHGPGNRPAIVEDGEASASPLRPIGEIAFALTARRIREHLREVA